MESLFDKLGPEAAFVLLCVAVILPKTYDFVQKVIGKRSNGNGKCSISSTLAEKLTGGLTLQPEIARIHERAMERLAESQERMAEAQLDIAKGVADLSGLVRGQGEVLIELRAEQRATRAAAASLLFSSPRVGAGQES